MMPGIDFACEEEVVDPGVVAACPRLKMPNLAKVEDNMKNMSRRKTTSTNGVSGIGLVTRFGPSMRTSASGGRKCCHFFEVTRLLVSNPVGNEARQSGFHR